MDWPSLPRPGAAWTGSSRDPSQPTEDSETRWFRGRSAGADAARAPAGATAAGCFGPAAGAAAGRRAAARFFFNTSGFFGSGFFHFFRCRFFDFFFRCRFFTRFFAR